MNSKRKYDVIVVGGGPAGAAAARESVRLGLETLIIEKKKMPRHKSCSGMLMYESVDLVKAAFGDIPLNLLSDPFIFHSIRFHFDSGRSLDIPLKAIIVKRNEFDHWLCLESGAEIAEKTELLSLEEKHDGITIRCRTPDEPEVHMTCKVLIGADGAKSTVSHLIDPERRKQLFYYSVVQDYYDCSIDLEPGYFHFFHSANLAYYPVVYWKNNRLVVDTNVEGTQHLLDERVKLNAFLERCYNFKISKAVHRIGCQWAMPALQDKFFLGTDRVLMTGDAGGFTKMLGEGISAALATGRIAGASAFKGLSNGNKPGHIYQKAVRPEVRRTKRDFAMTTQLKHFYKGIRNRPLLEKVMISSDFLKFARDNRAMNQKIQSYIGG